MYTKKNNHSNFEPQVFSMKETLTKIKRKFENGERFSFVRFEDVELRLMDNLGDKPVNHRGSPELRQDIKDAFQIQDPNWCIATLGGITREKDDYLLEYADDPKKVNPIFGYPDEALRENIKVVKKYSRRSIYYNPPVLYYFAVYHPHIFINFIDQYIRTKRIIYVGGEHLDTPLVNKVFNVRHFIQIPPRDAYYSMSKFYPRLEELLPHNDLVLVSMGNGKIGLQLKLWREYKFPTFDIGSLSGALNGDINRGWILGAQDNIQNLIKLIKEKW